MKKYTRKVISMTLAFAILISVSAGIPVSPAFAESEPPEAAPFVLKVDSIKTASESNSYKYHMDLTELGNIDWVNPTSNNFGNLIRKSNVDPAHALTVTSLGGSIVANNNDYIKLSWDDGAPLQRGLIMEILCNSSTNIVSQAPPINRSMKMSG